MMDDLCVVGMRQEYMWPGDAFGVINTVFVMDLENGACSSFVSVFDIERIFWSFLYFFFMNKMATKIKNPADHDGNSFPVRVG